MLTIHRPSGAAPAASQSLDVPDDAVWIDLREPTAEEVAAVARLTDFELPTFDELREVERSSRLRRLNGALIMSMPLAFSDAHGIATTPVGFVLTKERLITMRFQGSRGFDMCAERLSMDWAGDRPDAAKVFILLLESLVDRLADKLEEIGDGLDLLAGRVFAHQAPSHKQVRPLKVKDAVLRGTMGRIGRSGQALGKLRASLLAIGRITPYLEAEGQAWLDDMARSHLETLRQDIVSLDEYETHLTDKVQFLLDAAIGLITIEQNNTFKVLTIASVVGIPPTLIASMYGMNFRAMPELNWAWGYPYALVLILLSAIVPVIWFRWKGWF